MLAALDPERKQMEPALAPQLDSKVPEERAEIPSVVLTARHMTAADHERLRGRISFLARKGEFGRAELAELVGGLVGAGDAR
jgi:hypothetical protein